MSRAALIFLVMPVKLQPQSRTIFAKSWDWTASVGIAPNKFVAKIASDLEKPDGFVKIDPPLKLFLDPLDVNKLWGIGKSTENKLKAIGIHTIRDFRHSDPNVLRPCVGSSLEHLLQLANGEDNRKVVPHRPAVTMSRETTFAPRH